VISNGTVQIVAGMIPRGSTGVSKSNKGPGYRTAMRETVPRAGLVVYQKRSGTTRSFKIKKLKRQKSSDVLYVKFLEKKRTFAP